MLEGADEKIRRYKEIKLKMAALKTEADSIEADFLKALTDELEDTKYKSVSWADGEGNKVSATDAASLKIVYPAFLKKIFGEAYKDVVTEETTYKVSAGASRMLTALYSREFIRDGDLEQLIDTLKLDEKSAKTLMKKLKGKRFDTDVKNLMHIGGLSEEEAKENAYLAAEIAVWNDFMKLMELQPGVDIDKALEWIDGAVIVEHTPKIRIDIA